MAIIGIFYFSGTGNTALIAGFLQQAFEAGGHTVILETMETYTRRKTTPDLTPYDLVGFGHPVLGLGSTCIPVEFARLLPQQTGKSGFVFQCCGDPHWINNHASRSLIRILKRKGISIRHESQYAMAVNFIFRWEDALVLQLYDAARRKSMRDADEIISGVERQLPMAWLLRGLCRMVTLLEEKAGARCFGLSLRTKDTCNSCGLCAHQCPRDNIRMNKSRPAFGSRCIFCMRCVYGCPREAIHSPLFGFTIVEGYNGGAHMDPLFYSPMPQGNPLTEKTRGYFRHFWEYIRDCNA